MSKELENAWAVQEIWQDKCYKLEEENRKLKEERDFFKEQAKLWRNDWKVAYEENRLHEKELEYLRKRCKELEYILEHDYNRIVPGGML